VDGTRGALIVASGRYTDPGLRQLRAPSSDARALEAVLRNPDIGGFEVRTLLNKPAHLVNLAVEEFFADRRSGDLLLVHFSGHGIKDQDGELYFAAPNTRMARLGATAVSAEFVSRRMTRSRSRRVVLLLDCCYAGAFERGLVARAGAEVGIEQQLGGRGRAVITASSAMEYAFEAGELADAREVPPSVFTSALVQGLETGEADRNQDGLVGLDELYDYVYDKVRAATPNQTPGKWAFGMEGELYIARRSHPITTPAALPPELQQAIDSALTGIRSGAVQELAGMLRGSHAGIALAARLALERLTDDDSRTVAAAATAALGVHAGVDPVRLPATRAAANRPDATPIGDTVNFSHAQSAQPGLDAVRRAKGSTNVLVSQPISGERPIMGGSSSPLRLRRRLRTELRTARLEKGLTQEQVAEAMDWSLSKINQIERAKVGITTNDLKMLLRLYGITNPKRTEELLALSRAARKTPWWRRYSEVAPAALLELIDHESAASAVSQFETTFVPGILQTEEYALAILQASYDEYPITDRIAALVDLRTKRRGLLTSENAPKCSFIVDESVILRLVGSPSITSRQLQLLVDVAELPNVIIQILPFKASVYPAMKGPFEIVEFADAPDETIVFSESRSNFISDDPREAEDYLRTFRRITEISLGPSDSVDRLHRAVNEWQSQ
jgi:transcriptional regulator with XRE-family HTH domain